MVSRILGPAVYIIVLLYSKRTTQPTEQTELRHAVGCRSHIVVVLAISIMEVH